MIDKIKPRFLNIFARMGRHWHIILICLVGFLLTANITIQLLYPADRLALFAKNDGIDMSGWQKSDVIRVLDSKYLDKKIPIYFGTSKNAYRSPKPSEIGLTINNEIKINAIDYPWYLRIVPTSIFWMHLFPSNINQVTYRWNVNGVNSYIDKELGQSCSVLPKDASLIFKDNKLEVIPSENGGTCEIANVYRILTESKPTLSDNYRITVPVVEILPAVSNEAALAFADSLQKKASEGVSLVANGTAQVIPTNELLSWIDFASKDGKLTYVFNTERALVYLEKEFSSKVALAAGTTTISTYDFAETGRINGAVGKKLDVAATLANLKISIDAAKSVAEVATAPVLPKVVYSRTYSKTDAGLSAKLQQYSEDHAGIFGVTLIELSGQGRRAAYNDTRIFTTASTYKLFVAYSTLKRIEEGIWHWTDQITPTRNMSTCLSDMIVKSDNECGAILLDKVGYRNITNEAHDIGCTSTSFLGNDGIKTTAADLALLLSLLQTGQVLTQQSSRDFLINAMKLNVFRQGIPSGVSSMVVADKVGFMDGLLHDASIVYSPTGTYILVIMTDGSSWSTIADFAREIESLRTL